MACLRERREQQGGRQHDDDLNNAPVKGPKVENLNDSYGDGAADSGADAVLRTLVCSDYLVHWRRTTRIRSNLKHQIIEKQVYEEILRHHGVLKLR